MISAIAVVAAAAVLIGSILFVRRRRTGRLPGPAYVALVASTIAFQIIGTVFQVSGVLLAVPVIASLVFVLWRSEFRLGDLAVYVLCAGLGLGAAVLIEGAVHPDTGSQADQGAVVLLVIGLLVGLAALVRSGRLKD